MVIAHWAIFEMTFIDTDGQAKNCKWKKEFEISKQPDEEKKNRTVSAGYLKKE